MTTHCTDDRLFQPSLRAPSVPRRSGRRLRISLTRDACRFLRPCNDPSRCCHVSSTLPGPMHWHLLCSVLDGPPTTLVTAASRTLCQDCPKKQWLLVPELIPLDLSHSAISTFRDLTWTDLLINSLHQRLHSPRDIRPA